MICTIAATMPMFNIPEAGLLLVLAVVRTLGDPGGQEHPTSLAAHPGRDVELAERFRTPWVMRGSRRST